MDSSSRAVEVVAVATESPASVVRRFLVVFCSLASSLSETFGFGAFDSAFRVGRSTDILESESESEDELEEELEESEELEALGFFISLVF